MIKSKKELRFYIAADSMMNRGIFHRSFISIMKDAILPDYIMKYLRMLRYCQYNENKRGRISQLLLAYYTMRFRSLGFRCSFSIGNQCFGYGLVIPHYGTIVVGSSNRIGNYAVLHTSTCITNDTKVIGDGLYLSTGAKMTSSIQLGNNISIGANSVVNKEFTQNDIMVAGAPAKYIKDAQAWYIRDGELYHNRVKAIEALRKQLDL